MERVVNNASPTETVDRKTNEYRHRWKVSLYKVISAVERVNPDDCVFSIEGFKVFD